VRTRKARGFRAWRPGHLLARRGITLIEVLVVLAIVAVISGVAIFGFGGMSSSKLKRASTQIAGAVRIAYAHATATSKVTRLTFNFDEHTMYLETTSDRHLVRRDQAGGAEAATEIEEQAQATAASVLGGPRAGRAYFEPADAFGFGSKGEDACDACRRLPSGIQFWQVDTSHQQAPIDGGGAYLYFFPGGQTENAAIQIRVSNADEADVSDFMTVIVSPLTGKTAIHRGRIDMPKARDETEASEREDPL
jgi:general secretion pathway protein H